MWMYINERVVLRCKINKLFSLLKLTVATVISDAIIFLSFLIYDTVPLSAMN